MLQHFSCAHSSLRIPLRDCGPTGGFWPQARTLLAVTACHGQPQTGGHLLRREAAYRLQRECIVEMFTAYSLLELGRAALQGR